jgi:hypothetical protein
VTNLPHYNSNVVIHHDDAIQRCDSDVTLRRNFALSRHNRQPWRYYDDNIFSEDSDDDVGALLESDGDDNDGHDGNDGHDSNNSDAGQGPDGSDEDTSNGGDQPPKQVPPLNPKNAGNERVWDWNDIDAGGTNGVHEPIVVEPIVNVQGNEETVVPSAERLYEQADEELDNDANIEVSFEEGAEEDIAHSHNGASNGLAKGTASGSITCGNTNAASTGNGGNGPRTVSETEPTESIPNQGIQDNPPPLDMNVNSQVPHVVVPTVNNTSREENVLVNEMHMEDVQGSMPSIGTTLIALGRTTLGTSNRPPKHQGPRVQRSVLRTFGNRNSNDGPWDSSRDPRIGQQSKNGSQGCKRLLDAREVWPFYTEGTRGGSSRIPTSIVVHGPDVDEKNDISTTRRVKRFVKTKVVGTI